MAPKFSVFDLSEKAKNAFDSADREMYEDRLGGMTGESLPPEQENPDEKDLDLSDFA